MNNDTNNIEHLWQQPIVTQRNFLYNPALRWRLHLSIAQTDWTLFPSNRLEIRSIATTGPYSHRPTPPYLYSERLDRISIAQIDWTLSPSIVRLPVHIRRTTGLIFIAPTDWTLFPSTVRKPIGPYLHRSTVSPYLYVSSLTQRRGYYYDIKSM